MTTWFATGGRDDARPAWWQRTVAAPRRDDVRLPGAAVAGCASIGAGAVHAAWAGAQAGHPTLARLLVAVAIAEVAAGIASLVRPRRAFLAGLALVDLLSAAGWMLTRLAGVSAVDGLQQRQPMHAADAIAALLAAVGAATAACAVLAGWQPARRQRTTLPALAVAAFALPGMVVASTTSTSAATAAAATAAGAPTPGASAAGATPAAATTTLHVHTDDTATATTATPDATAAGSGDGPSTTAHHHDTTTTATGSDPTAAWPRPWDPTKPIDLSGVPGVTAEEQARATALVEGTLQDLPRWADTKQATADGYASIGDGVTGFEHYIKTSLIEDDVLLDPTQPESLVYKVDGDQRILQGAMYIASARSTDDPTIVNWAGPLMQWHNHGNLCWDLDKKTGKPKVVGLVGADGTCARGVNTGGANPMVHVWITPNQCGVFAALEGVGAGQAAVPDSQRVDLCTGQHDHGSSGSAPTTTVVVHAYDPALPIDLSGTPGVTPQQQAAAENLVAETVVRLPKWADYHTALAAGFHSIGDGLTGAEHFINWDWINDDVWLDPDHPESLVYQPQPDGSKKLVSAMYMLPDTVTLDQVPDIGGALMQWHIHDNLCFTSDPVAPQVAGITNAQGGCSPGLQKFRPAPMIHVWIVPHPCGPFAALEGVGAGQILPGETRLCDHQHGDGLLG